MKRPIRHIPARAPEAIQFARDQRTMANEFAQTVWLWIRNRHICGQKFRRLVLRALSAESAASVHG